MNIDFRKYFCIAAGLSTESVISSLLLQGSPSIEIATILFLVGAAYEPVRVAVFKPILGLIFKR